jgi:hypothetical protein
LELTITSATFDIDSYLLLTTKHKLDMENKNNTKANAQNNKTTAHNNNAHTNNAQNNNEHTGRQGFASMPHDKVVEIASMGGHASHKNTNSKTEDNKNSENQNKGSHTASRSSK